MNKLMQFMIGKIACRGGNHKYKPGTWKFTFVCEDGNYWVFRLENTCERCGKPYRELVRIPNTCLDKEGE